MKNRGFGYEVTGQIFTREVSMKAPDGSDRQVLSIVGVIAVPLDAELQDSHQYTVVGARDGLTLIILPDGKDMRKETKGWSANQLLTEPIWRV